MVALRYLLGTMTAEDEDLDRRRSSGDLVFDRIRESGSFVAAVHEGLSDSAADRLIDDDELDDELDAEVGPLR